MAGKYLSMPAGYTRTDNTPLMSDERFMSLAEAEAFVAEDPTCYIGQSFSVVEGDDCNIYIVRPDKTLKPVGANDTASTYPSISFTGDIDASYSATIAVVPANTYIKSCIIEITEAFGAGDLISVGTEGEPEVIYASAYIDPETIGTYEIPVNMVITAETTIKVYVTKPEADFVQAGTGTVKLVTA